MPELPTPEAVFGRRPVPKSNRTALGYEAGQEAKAYARAGEVLQESGARLQDEVVKRQKEKSNLELAKAQSYVLQATTELETELMRDPDYSTHLERWNKGMAEIQAGALPLVPADKRELFGFALQDINTRSVASLQKNIFQREGQAMAGEVVKTQETMTFTAAQKMEAGDIPGALAAVEIAKNAARAAQAAGAYNGMADNGQSIIEGIGRDIIEPAIGKIPASQRVQLLSPAFGPPAPANAPLSVRNNNPGNIRGPDGNFIKFPTKEAGVEEMRRDLTVKVTGRSAAMKGKFGENYTPTLKNLISTWAPETENDTDSYVATVARETGIAPDDVLTEADIDKIMPAMIKVEGGAAASQNFSNISPIAKYISPEKYFKMLNDAREEEVYSVIDTDPAAALVRLEDGTLGQGLDPSRIKILKEESRSALDKSYDRAEMDRLANNIVADRGNYEKFVAGEMTLADVGRLEAESGPSEFTRMARAKLTTDAPKQAPEARLAEFSRLQSSLQDIKSRAVGDKDVGNLKASVKTIGDFKRFQDEVHAAVRTGLISEDEGETFLGKFSTGVMDAIYKNKTEGDGPTIVSGVQDPYKPAFKAFDRYLKNNGRADDLLAKKELTMRFADFIGDYESTGNTQKDELVVNEAIRLAKESFIKDEVPVLRTLSGTPNAVLTSDGTKKGVAAQADLKPSTAVKVPFKIMEDAAGNRARVYDDGRIEELN